MEGQRMEWNDGTALPRAASLACRPAPPYPEINTGGVYLLQVTSNSRGCYHGIVPGFYADRDLRATAGEYSTCRNSAQITIRIERTT